MLISEAPPIPTINAPVRIESPAVPDPPDYAGFWKRAGALAVDMIIVYFLMAAGLSAVGPAVEALEGNGTISAELRAPFGQFLTTYIFLLSHWLYYSLTESSRTQATLGKLLLRIRVTDLEGQPVSFLRASARNLGKILSELTYWVGFLMAGFSPRKQALHDYLAGCIVVNAPVPRTQRDR